MTTLLFIVLVALALDRVLPDRGGFYIWEWYADWTDGIEQRFNGGLRSQGLYAVILAVIPIAILVFLADVILGQIATVLEIILATIVVYLSVELQRLGTSAYAIATALEHDDVRLASAHLKSLTGKDTVESTGAGIAHATVESVLKQANSLVVAPIFWFLLVGPVGAMSQRMTSILDRQWGHRDARFAEFGKVAARLDDLFNWVPARITAVSYAVMGSFEDAMYCWRRKAGMWSDISSGPLLASGLGALHLDTEEQMTEDLYGNRDIHPAALPGANDVRRAVALVWRVMLFWLTIGVLMAAAHLSGLFTR